MNRFNFSKIFIKCSTISLASIMAYGSASAFIIDSSQQKTITISRPAPKPTNYTAQQNSQEIVHQTQSKQAASYTTTPAPMPQIHQTQTVQALPVPSQNTTTNYSSQAISSSNTNQIFDQLAISTQSSAVVVYDVQTGQSIYAKNVDAKRSIASISKMMTAMVILDAELDMREEISLLSSDMVGAKRASTNLKAGDRMTRSEFTLLMLMKSENPAAKALARTYPNGYDAFIAAMNRKAQELGMYQTSFKDASGLDPRNVSSANDLIKMMKAINSDPRYHSIRNFSTAPAYDFYISNFNHGDRTYKANNTNRLVRSGGHPIGVQKTGYIREAGYCVVMETNVNHRPSIIVLLGGNSSNARWNDAEKILTELSYR